MLEEYDKKMIAQAQSYAARMSAPAPSQNEPEMLPRKMTLNEENAHASVEDGICTADIEAIMAKPISELKELYNHRDIEK